MSPESWATSCASDTPVVRVDPRHLVALDVDRAVDVLEQVGDAGDREAHHAAADVIGVVVRGEHTGDGHPVGADAGRPARRVVGRIDEHALAGGPVADRVDEVDHLLRDLIVDGEVAARQELPEVEPVVG